MAKKKKKNRQNQGQGQGQDQGQGQSQGSDRRPPPKPEPPKPHPPPPREKPKERAPDKSPKSSEKSSEKADPKSRDTVVVSGHGGSKRVYATKPMRRPAYGTAGKKTNVLVNFFKTSVPQALVGHQYSITIWRKKRQKKGSGGRKKEDKAPTRQPPSDLPDYENIADSGRISYNRAVFNQMWMKYKNNIGKRLAYDGRSMAYSAGEIERNVLGVKLGVDVGREGDPPTDDEVKKKIAEKVYVIIAYAKSLKFADVVRGFSSTISSAEYLACLDVALAASPMTSYVQIGRSFYTDSGAEPLGRRDKGPHLASAWRGFYQSARLSEMGLVVNLDESYTAFWNRGGHSLMYLVRDANMGKDLTSNDTRYMKKVANSLKSLKVRAIHTGIIYKMHGFINKSADTYTFQTKDGKKTSITNYFHKAYNIRLRHGNLALINVHPKRDTLVPIELLVVVPRQRVVGLLTPDQTKDMVKIASSRSPADRTHHAEHTMQRLNHTGDKTCREFGIKVDPKVMRVNARILPPPRIQYKEDQVLANNGQWRARGPSVRPARLTNWVVINTARLRSDKMLYQFIEDLIAAMQRAGMKVDVLRPRVIGCRLEYVTDEMKKAVRQETKKPLELIVIVKEEKETPVYNAIKRCGDLELGIATQVLLSEFVSGRRRREVICDNVVLKINAKLGGMNSYVREYQRHVPNPKFERKPNIVLGADVTHPVGGSDGPSVAALVGSVDKVLGQYASSIRCQAGRKEMISQLGEMFHEIYYQWHVALKGQFKAEGIIMFRDGVSEGQFEEVMQVEVAAIRRTIRHVHKDPNAHIPITYIIVTKRHHTRFFPERKEDGDLTGNIQPGTCVDRGIVSNEYFDFYLNSHAGVKGTNKPSKYTVLLDENDVNVDALQGYVYRLSHGFMRCTRAVSMVSSTYYAHLMAFRGRAYLGDDGSSDSGSTASGSRSGSIPNIKLHERLKGRLFFL